MPIYVFRCSRCDHEFKELLWPSESITAVRCPSCDSGEIDKQMAPFAVRSATKDAAGEAAPFCGRCGQNRPPCDG